jgi:general secretion pathway protein G
MNMIEKRKQMRGQGGFTLIELLVVIAILGILAGVVVFAVGNVTDNAKESACQIEERTMKTAVEAASANNEPVSDWLEDVNGEFFVASGSGSTASYAASGTLPSGC